MPSTPNALKRYPPRTRVFIIDLEYGALGNIRNQHKQVLHHELSSK